jgi:integrase
MATGIRPRHRRNCQTVEGSRCTCRPGYEAAVFSRLDGKKIRRTFQTEAAAKLWRAEAFAEVRKGARRAPKPTTIRAAWCAWLEGAKAGVIRNRSGDPYKPSALRSYERAMRLRVLPEFGAAKLADVGRRDLQRFVRRLQADGLNASTVQVTLLPLRAIYREAIDEGHVAVNPCDGLKVPRVTRRRERFASPQEAAKLIGAAPEPDRAVWATALYGGLPRGELQALRWESVDLASGVIRVEHGWDAKVGQIELKSNAGRRKVPIAAILRDHLIQHRLRTGRTEGLVFGRTPEEPLRPEGVIKRADTAWRRVGLRRITLHECRHSFASMMIDAGVNAKALSVYMGHANISITLDRYGHLMPGNEEEAAQRFNAYLTSQQEHADERARAAEPGAGEAVESATLAS